RAALLFSCAAVASALNCDAPSSTSALPSGASAATAAAVSPAFEAARFLPSGLSEFSIGSCCHPDDEAATLEDGMSAGTGPPIAIRPGNGSEKRGGAAGATVRLRFSSHGNFSGSAEATARGCFCDCCHERLLFD